MRWPLVERHLRDFRLETFSSCFASEFAKSCKLSANSLQNCFLFLYHSKISVVFADISLSHLEMQVIIPRLWGFDFGLALGISSVMGINRSPRANPFSKNN